MSTDDANRVRRIVARGRAVVRNLGPEQGARVEAMVRAVERHWAHLLPPPLLPPDDDEVRS